MEKVQSFINDNKQRFLDELLDMLRIPSVSADPKHKEDMLRMAENVRAGLLAAGVDHAEIHPTKGNPIVFGEKIIDPSLPTVLVYGHYDVQPADPINLWLTPAFEPTIKKTDIHPDGAIFARGSCDDKGQFYMHVKAVEAMIKNDALPCNVKFMIEGEEEVGSVNLGDFCRQNKEKLACDVIVISDTSIIANDTPSITTGLRGLAYLEVEVTGPNVDLHSGVYGGAVANPINTLCKMIASLQDEAGRITIPGFYDDVVEVTLAERAEMDKAPFNLEKYKKGLDINDIQGEHGYTTMERTSIRPTLDVNGMWGGYTGEGAKTVLPSKAYAKISMRLVPNQTDEAIYKLFEDHFLKIAPPSVKVKVTPHHGGLPAVTPTDTLEYKAAHMAMEQTFGKPPIPKREGGSIPIVALFEDVLKVKTILMGFGLDSDALHSPNEHYGLFNFYKGIETIPYFFKFYSELKK
jgi:acetylornithine deacetylase/succinyl-diaminopimelate desuccinylase-like protein